MVYDPDKYPYKQAAPGCFSQWSCYRYGYELGAYDDERLPDDWDEWPEDEREPFRVGWKDGKRGLVSEVMGHIVNAVDRGELES